MSTRTTLILYSFLFLIIFFVIMVRTVGLFSSNVLFLFDSARDFLFVKKIVVDHKLILIGPSSGGLQGYFQGVIWYYMLSIPFALSGGNPIAGTWFMAIMSTLSVLATFFILKKIMNIYAGILGVLFLGFGEYSVATSSFIWNPFPIVWLMPFYFLSIYLISKQSKYGIFLLSIIQGLLLHFEVIYGLGTFPAYVFIVFFYWIQTGKKIRRVKNIFIALLLFCLPMIPSLLFDIRHNFLITRSIVQTVSTGGGTISHKKNEIPNTVVRRLQLRLDDFFTYSFGSTTKSKQLNYLLLALLILTVITIAKKNRQEKTVFLLTLCMLASPFFVFMFLKYSVWGYYWIGNAPLCATFMAYIFGFYVQKYRKPLYFTILVIVLLFIAKPWSIFPYWYKGNLEAGPQTFSTQLKVIQTIYKDADEQPFSVYEQTPPVYDYVYRYLLWWQGSKRYGYIPTDQKQKLVYVVLEGVPEDQDATFFTTHTLHLTNAPSRTFRFGVSWPIVKKFVADPKEQPVDPNFFPQL